jgi:hypothetical protein
MKGIWIAALLLCCGATWADPPVHIMEVNGEDAEFDSAASGSDVDVEVASPSVSGDTESFNLTFSNFTWTNQESFVYGVFTYDTLNAQDQVTSTYATEFTLRDLDPVELASEGCTNAEACSGESGQQGCGLSYCRKVTSCAGVCLAAIATCNWLTSSCSCSIATGPSCILYGSFGYQIVTPKCTGTKCRVTLFIMKV